MKEKPGMNEVQTDTPAAGVSLKHLQNALGRRTLYLDPHEILVDMVSNGRFEPENLSVDDLIYGPKSMLVLGQLQPIEVVKVAGKYRVQLGIRRTLAARKINDLKLGDSKFLIEAVEAVAGNSEDTFRRNVAENYQRQTLTHMDIAAHLRRWIEVYHKDQRWCCEFYGAMGKPMSQSWFAGHMALLKLEPAIQHKVHAGELSWQAARELTKNLSPEEQQQVLELVGGSGERPTIENVVRRKRALNRLDKPRSRPKSEVVEGLVAIAGSPDCPVKVRKFLDMLVEFVKGKHDVDLLSDVAWRLN